MIQVDRRTVRAPLERVLAAAADVERWPEWLSHYRWVRFLERRSQGGLVEMAAWRPFGLFSYPTWWVSEMQVDRDRPRITYRHVRGITRGMDVAWDFQPGPSGVAVTITHRWNGPAWPLIRAPAANLVIGPIFIHGIAQRTLAGLARVAASATPLGTPAPGRLTAFPPGAAPEAGDRPPHRRTALPPGAAEGRGRQQ